MTQDAARSRLQGFVSPFTRRFWIEKWDWMIYRFAHHSIRRMCERNGGFAYLFELWIRQWRKENPIPRSLESATEHFFESTGGSREVVDEASWFRTTPEEADKPVPDIEPTISSEAMAFIDGLAEKFGERLYDEALNAARAKMAGEVTMAIARDAAEEVIQAWKHQPTTAPLGERLPSADRSQESINDARRRRDSAARLC